MKITKRIIIRIIVAVAVTIILSKLKLIGIMKVSALTANTTFSYENVLISQKQVEFLFTTPFATNMKKGTLKTNVVINNNIVPSTGNIPTTLRQAIVYNGTSSNVCSIGTVNTGSIFSESNQSSTNRIDIRSTTYTLECEVTPNPKIEKIILYFSGTMNYAYLSFGPNVSFRENDLLLDNISCLDFASKSSLKQGGTDVNNDTFFGSDTRITTKDWITLLPGDYTISSSSNDPLQIYFMTNDYNNFPNDLLYKWNSSPLSFKIQKELKIKFNIRNSSNTTISMNDISSFSLNGCVNKQDLSFANQQEQTKQQKETNDLIKSDDTTESSAKGKDFFDNFTSDSHGLSGVITSPIRLLNSFTTSSCSPLEFDLPFNMGHVSLPCMRGIYEQHFGIFFSLWQLITTGLISYNVCLNFYSKIRAMQNPYNDRIEVLNL